MNRCIHYMLSDTPHGPYLVVSLDSLKDWYSGPIVLHGWEETGAYDVVKEIAQDKRLGDIRVEKRAPAFRGHGDYWVDKIDIMMAQRGMDSSVLLDADTVIVGSIDHIFEATERTGYAVTQFCDWKTTNNIIKNRVKRLRPFTDLNQSLIEDCLQTPYPSPNVGIFGCVYESPVMKTWRRWSYIAREIFIADESTMQALSPPFVREGVCEIIDGRWNCSTMRFQHVPDEDVHIWHGHGNSFLRPTKSPKGHKMWWDRFEKAKEENLGNILNWLNRHDSKWMRRCLKDREEGEWLKKLEECK